MMRTNFIIFDLEFNQDISPIQNSNRIRPYYPFEIIQIGAIKLDSEFNTLEVFNRYVRPTYYTKINQFVTELTGIKIEQLQTEEPFPAIYQEYLNFINEDDPIFCVWGMTDIIQLFKNAEDHKLDNKLLPKKTINIQPYISKKINLPQKNLFSLRHAVEMLGIPVTYPFHNALHDAYYTAEIFKKIYDPSIQPILYDPSYIQLKPIKLKRVIDTDNLLAQFEKMYTRKMTQEEQKMILLAYKMGRTHQFLKEHNE